MLNIIYNEEEASATQTYAHTRWLGNPAIAPAYWHQVLGHTVGKIALDATHAFTQPQLLTQGVNLVLTSPSTHAQVAHALSQIPLPPETFLTAHLTAAPTSIPAGTTYLIWQVPPHVTQTFAAPVLQSLEGAVRQGLIQAYGIHDADLTAPASPRPLHQWIEWAADAAQQVHGRRKRPALQLIAAPLSLFDLSLLTTVNTLHKQEEVSPLELASRLGLAVLALSPVFPASPHPGAQALQTLTGVAQAEHAFNTALGGWPAVGGQPLFSVLAALGAGVPPWPTLSRWQHWHRHLWPVMQTFLAGHPLPQAAALGQAVENLLPFGPCLALHAAQPAFVQKMENLSSHLPANWAAQPAAVLNPALLSSLPGLAVLALPQVSNLQAVQILGDFTDPGILFTSPPHLS